MSAERRVPRWAGEVCGPPNPTAVAIAQECDSVRKVLLAKNEAYGNSALAPLRVFSRADPIEQLKVRIDDKLSRIARGNSVGEDTVLDLIGYLILLRIAQRQIQESQDGDTIDREAERAHTD